MDNTKITVCLNTTDFRGDHSKEVVKLIEVDRNTTVGQLRDMISKLVLNDEYAYIAIHQLNNL